MDRRMNPKSLENLAPEFTKDNAKEMQLRSAEARRINAEVRNRLRMTMKDWKLYKEEVLDEFDMKSVDVLKILMMKAMDAGDMSEVAELAKAIAEYEQPKLQRIESKVEEVKTDELSDEELDDKLRQLRIIK